MSRLGNGKMKMWVEWDDHNTTAYSPTFQFNADNIVVKSISFRNAYNNPINTDTRVLAVVAMISGDKSYFYRVVMAEVWHKCDWKSIKIRRRIWRIYNSTRKRKSRKFKWICVQKLQYFLKWFYFFEKALDTLY
ncbi:hypothetical protein Ahy_B07g088170 [Arachis hypogaea]|uniref:Uncharacterized protein n=1 Tax=Arachis hypogaea TaxID=3818 RepID=A0A444YDV2_ARAHY|nr:hypothetical protein Ahy_B07g088170 [Arachis hypogaea]